MREFWFIVSNFASTPLCFAQSSLYVYPYVSVYVNYILVYLTKLTIVQALF